MILMMGINNNDYLLSVSSYKSVVELHNLSSTNDIHHTWTAKNFFEINGKDYIFSYEFSLFELKNEKAYIIAFNPIELNSNECKYYMIKKFKIKSFDSNAYEEIRSVFYDNNYNNRIVCSFSMDDFNIIVVFYTFSN